MPISKIKTSSITADAASINLNIDANTLFLDVANNRVGVGTTSPYRQLQIGDYSTSAVMALGSSAAGTGTFCFASSDNAPGRYVGTIAYNHQANAMIFGVNAVEAARFDSNGNLGVGTSTPLSKLDVSVEATLTRRFLVNYDDSVVTIKSANNQSNPESLKITGDNIRFNTGTSGSGTERMRILAGGNVGIGTNAPVAKFEVFDSTVNAAFVANTPSTWRVAQIRHDQTGANGTAAGIAFVGKDDTKPAGIVAINGNTTGGIVSLGFLTVDGNTTAERMRIDSSGNTIIGGGAATSSAGFLQINTQVPNTSSSSLGFNSADNAVISSRFSMVFQVDNTNSIAGRAFEFRKGGKGYGDGSPLMNLDSSGNFLVGTTTAIDSSKFQFIGAKAFSSGIPQGQLNIADSTSYSAGGGGAIAFGGKYHSAGFYTTFASIEGVKENATDGHYSGNLLFRVRLNSNDNIERMRIDGGGYVHFGGLSTNATRGLVNVVAPSGNGCGFSFAETTGGTRGRLFWSGSAVNLINDDNSVLALGTTGTQRVTISAGGTVTFNVYGAGTLTTNASGVISASDGRFKYKTRSVENAIALVNQLSPTYYRWNDDCDFHTEYEELGFIAQEVAAVIPEASPEVEKEPEYMEDGIAVKTNFYKNYSDRSIIAVLVKAMQEQQALITQLTDRITALEAK
jgi:hypothetical protein